MSVASDAMAGFDAFPFEAGGCTKTVFVRGEGRAVLLLHDVAGLTPGCIALANRFARSGLRVYVPLLFGWPGQASRILGCAQAVLSRNFSVFADEGTSAITDWLRPLCREISARDDWRRIGVVGMGVTGGPGKAATIMAAAGLGKPTGNARSGRMRAIPGPPASRRGEAY